MPAKTIGEITGTTKEWLDATMQGAQQRCIAKGTNERTAQLEEALKDCKTPMEGAAIGFLFGYAVGRYR